MSDATEQARIFREDGAAVVAVYRRINDAVGMSDHGHESVEREFLTQAIALLAITADERRDAVLTLAAWSSDEEWERIERALSELAPVRVDLKVAISIAAGCRKQPQWAASSQARVIAATSRSRGAS